jgi:hypothetical protein
MRSAIFYDVGACQTTALATKPHRELCAEKIVSVQRFCTAIVECRYACRRTPYVASLRGGFSSGVGKPI